jgi:hypothetical protein
MVKANPFQPIKVNQVQNHGNVETVAAFFISELQMEMTDEFYGSVVSLPHKASSVKTEYEAGWVPELVWTPKPQYLSNISYCKS